MKQDKMLKVINSWPWRITKAGLKQSEFCRRFGFYQGHLCDIIKGRKLPKQETFDRIESAIETLGV